MTSPEQLFSLANTVALITWLLLGALPGRAWVTTRLAGGIVPLLFAGAYAAIVAATFGQADGGFSTLAGVAALFENKWMLLAG